MIHKKELKYNKILGSIVVHKVSKCVYSKLLYASHINFKLLKKNIFTLLQVVFQPLLTWNMLINIPSGAEGWEPSLKTPLDLLASNNSHDLLVLFFQLLFYPEYIKLKSPLKQLYILIYRLSAVYT